MRRDGRDLVPKGASGVRISPGSAGVAPPAVSIEKGATTKAGVVPGLADAIAFCDPAFVSLTEASAAEFVRKGAGELARGAVLAGLLAHNAEMFGFSTVYLRSKNLVPPGSR